ncbi:hypothetical protein Tco_1426726, partial [Tanacetum coccineum]
VRYCEDEEDCFTNFEAKFPAIVFRNIMEKDNTVSSRPSVSPLFEINPRTTMEEYVTLKLRKLSGKVKPIAGKLLTILR